MSSSDTQKLAIDRESGVVLPEVAEQLVLDHQGWAESIARSVARSWDMDWRGDGLDGAAMEALLFCARRFKPGMGVPFKGYARRRIHEASTEEARKSKGWQRGTSAGDKEFRAREVSAELFSVFPDLREGRLPLSEDSSGGAEDVRSAIKSLIVGASIIATKQEMESSSPDDILDLKRMLRLIATLEPIHQVIIWKVYWEGGSLRSVASDWETDELNVIREHKTILAYLHKGVAKGPGAERPKIRPGLRDLAIKVRRDSGKGGPFSEMLEKDGSNGKQKR